MTAPLSAERVEKLKQWLWHPAPKYYSLTTRDDIRRDIEVIIDDDSSLRAENELLNNNAMNDYAAHLELKARAENAEKSEAENERLREDFEYKNEQLGSAIIRAEKGEARVKELEAEIEQLRK
jgi:hypothetical protein